MSNDVERTQERIAPTPELAAGWIAEDSIQHDQIREIPGFHRRLGSSRAPAREAGGVRAVASIATPEAFRELDGVNRLILNSPIGWGRRPS